MLFSQNTHWIFGSGRDFPLEISGERGFPIENTFPTVKIKVTKPMGFGEKLNMEVLL